MNCYPMAAVKRMMKIQEVILRVMAKKITWWQAAETIGITDRQMRRWHWWYQEYGYDGLLDRRVGKPSPKRVPLAVVEQVFAPSAVNPIRPRSDMPRSCTTSSIRDKPICRTSIFAWQTPAGSRN